MKQPTLSAKREKDEWLHIQSISYNLTEDKRFLFLLTCWQIPFIIHTMHSSVRKMTKDAIQTGTERENEKQEGGEPRAQREAKHIAVFLLGNSLVHTQLFGASQQVLLIWQDVVQDKQLGGDRVALPSCSTTIRLLKRSPANVDITVTNLFPNYEDQSEQNYGLWKCNYASNKTNNNPSNALHWCFVRVQI